MLVTEAPTAHLKTSSISRLFAAEGTFSGLAIFYLSLVWIPVTLVALLLIVGVSWCWPGATVGSAIALPLLWRFVFRTVSLRNSIYLSLILLASLIVAALYSMFFYDVSFDGRWYHADAILGLVHGVNPIYAQIPAYVPIWANHFPKTTWYFAAFVIHIFHNYQLGKIYNLILVFSCATYAADVFRRLWSISPRSITVLAIATACSPVASAQLPTYYVDGALASLLSLVLLASISLVFRPARLDRLVLVMAASLLIDAKLSGGPYVFAAFAILITAQFIFHYRQKERALRDLAAAVLACVIGVLVIGFNPFITNMQQGLHPLYPVMGVNKVDVMHGNTPPVLMNPSYNRVQKFFISFFSQTQGAHTTTPVTMPGAEKTAVSVDQRQEKIPFTVRKHELLMMGLPDPRLAGWGIFFSGITLVSLALFLALKGWRGNEAILLAITLIVLTAFINPECWWARYAPQIGLLPVFLIVPSFQAASGKVRTAAWMLSGLLLINNLLFVAAGAGASYYLRSREIDKPFGAIARTAGPGEYWSYTAKGLHVDQFSGLAGIKICGQVGPKTPLPSGGFPISVNAYKSTDATLFKGSCAAGPPF